jgi:hypothetical protein
MIHVKDYVSGSILLLKIGEDRSLIVDTFYFNKSKIQFIEVVSIYKGLINNKMEQFQI